jgi:hypothetical protein
VEQFFGEGLLERKGIGLAQTEGLRHGRKDITVEWNFLSARERCKAISRLLAAVMKSWCR